MGLDMYLTAKIYIWNDEKAIKKNLLSFFPELKEFDGMKAKQIEFRIGYWRKANQIHRWFIDNVQKGKDDCGNYFVSLDNLKKLLDICNVVIRSMKLIEGKVVNGYSFDEKGTKIPCIQDGKVIDDPSVAMELLPSTTGFFFGSSDYDQWYYEDIKETIKILSDAIKLIEMDKGWSIEYHSSW